MTRNPWRFRECPHCGTVSPASRFDYVGTYRSGWHGVPADRRCPACTYTAPTPQFRTVQNGEQDEEWRSRWRTVLASGPWKKLRLEVIRAQKWRCARCDAFGGATKPTLELHHLHYDTLGRETVADVVALCKVCHSNADDERAAQGRSRSAASLWSARLEGFAASLGYQDIDVSVEARFEAWLAHRGEE